MTAKEAKIKAVWNSIPDSIRSKIQYMVGCGLLYAYLYKSLTPEAFNDIDTTIAKLQLLGYTVEYGKVDIEDDPNACGITTDTKLTIKW
jgi:hypothetical protein